MDFSHCHIASPSIILTAPLTNFHHCPHRRRFLAELFPAPTAEAQAQLLNAQTWSDNSDGVSQYRHASGFPPDTWHRKSIDSLYHIFDMSSILSGFVKRQYIRFESRSVITE
jgi:hypothetical protein